ncbi:flagellar hook capping FlgD N-terminal domain-containing protein [Nocardioides nitrophenolicus]|uniref:flagellar hook capping FlgD N-terminal domain-containing protein n=1 Tax=Nocardioides nitrophenolicus TaxID=60489 RepID=UPI000AC211C4|nr:flagellar hook capping FlgD N-terminal domain-containing protein [Nocardioides nitrophenolicus]MBM7516414.1 flagellar basal-body rod modification protein FlgD [Nocardioides nitrophenolicus]
MTVSGTEGIGYGVTGTATGTTGASGGSNTADKDMFLQLMVAQMKYQDPLNPTDSSQFLAQTAQFTALEKMQDVADQTAMLLSTQLAFGASSLIGQTVRWYDATGAEQSGVVQGTTYLATGPVLSVDGKSVAVTDVVSVGTAPTIEAPTTSGGGTYVPPSGVPSTTARPA